MNQYTYPSLLGPLTFCEEDGYLTAIHTHGPVKEAREQETEVIRRAYAQLTEYLAGERQTFDLPLAPRGTAFQQRVWQALCRIPYGETRSYKQIAEAIGHARAVRAVGMANHCNPLLIVVPCHRVIGSNGRLTGYAAGLEKKAFLLGLERKELFPLPPSAGNEQEGRNQ